MKNSLLFSAIALFILSSCGDKKPVSPHESATGQNISSGMAGRIKREGRYLAHSFLMGKYIVAGLIQQRPSHLIKTQSSAENQ